MAEFVVNIVVEQLISGVIEWMTEERSLLKGLKTELNNMKTKMLFIQTVLEDAENQSVKKKYVKIWLANLQDVSYDMDDVMDEWNSRLLIHKREEAEVNTSNEIVGSSSCLSFRQLNCFSSVKQLPWRRDIALRIKDINRTMNLVFFEMEQFKLVSKAVANDEQKKSLQVVSIVGAGGLGKTTLAQLVYNDEKVKKKFDKYRIWVCVSNQFDEVNVARAILEGLQVDHTKMENLQTLHKSIEGAIFKNKFLLILDDVWDENFGNWERLSICLKVGHPDSRILVTTRKEKVVRTMGITPSNTLKPRLISDSDCWLLMKQLALQGSTKKGTDKLEDMGKELAKKCNGLPLAAKTLGGLLLSKDSIQEWKEVLNSQIWELEEVEMNLFPHIFLSYQELPSVVKRCFLILALFPKGSQLHVEQIIHVWMAHGYLQPRIEQGDMVKMGQKYLSFLISRALLEGKTEQQKIVVSMHDIIHDFVLHLYENELLAIVGDDDIENGLTESSSERGTKSTKVRHLIIEGNVNATSIGFDLGKLRTCIVSKVSPHVALDLVKRLKIVRMLNLENCALKQVPESIVNLIHLRMLILSDNPLVALPETIGDLYNLQLLWLERIYGLSSIPQSLGKLINLISLKPCDLAPEKVPEAVGKLINLQSLVRVQIETGKSNLGFLKDLNQLRNLEIAFDSDYGDEVDALKAAIGRKKHITRLALFANNHNVTDGVIEALKPYPDIQTLTLDGVLPSWITFLHHLKDITLMRGYVLTLPPLWKLESLEKIVIYAVHSLKFIGREFMGIDNSPNNNFCAFPKLVELIFYGCSKLTGFEDLKPEEEGEIRVMPNLQLLTFERCSKLVEIPFRLIRQASSLKNLCIETAKLWFDFDVEFNADGRAGNVVLRRRQGNEELRMIVKSSRKVPISIIKHNYITLLHLHYQAEPILDLPPMGKLPYLQSLEVWGLSSLKFIRREFLGIDNEEFVAFPNLVKLMIYGCDMLEGWEDLKPEDEGKITVMPKLEALQIWRCPKFQVIPSRLLLKLSSSLKVLHLPSEFWWPPA